MKTTVIPGRKIGSVCPACKKGRLCVVTHHSEGDNGIMGPGGHSWSFDLIDRLGCDRCSASYEVEAALRNAKLQEMIGKQLKAFKQPAQKPDKCPDCRAKELTQDVYFDRKPFADYGLGEHDGETQYLYCGRCCHVVWILRYIPGATEKALNDILSMP